MTTSPTHTVAGMRRLLGDVADRSMPTHHWLIAQAVAQCGHDPAFVQALRLLLKEDQHLGKLAGESLARLGRTLVPTLEDSRLAQLRRLLGLRFEMSLLLLRHLLEAQLAQVAAGSTQGPLRDVLGQLRHDRLAHVAFSAEWLTVQFADFNFIRRNLRRLRWRGMFAALLLAAAVRHRRLLQAGGTSPLRFVRQNWTAFNTLLERMVPYHRDALLATLLNQREHPYDKPGAM